MRIKNIIIALLVGALLGFVGGYKYATKLLTPTLEKAIAKESTLVQNDIDLNVRKIKKADSLTININQKPRNTVVVEKNRCDSLSVCLEKKHLTRRQKRRLGIN